MVAAGHGCETPFSLCDQVWSGGSTSLAIPLENAYTVGVRAEMVNRETSLLITPEQIRMARCGLHMTFRALEKLAGVDWATINRIEKRKQEPEKRTLARLRQALEAMGAEFRPGGWVRVASAVQAGHPQEGTPDHDKEPAG